MDMNILASNIDINFLVSFFASLLANGLTTILNYGISTKLNKAKYTWAKINSTLMVDKLIIKHIEDLKAKLISSDFIQNESRSTMLLIFLESPTVENIIRQLYSDSIGGEAEGNNVKKLREEFTTCLAIHFGVSEEAISFLAEKIFQVLISGTNRALNLAIEKNILLAHEVKDIVRHKFLKDELNSIKSILEFLNNNKKINSSEIIIFEKKYREQIREWARLINVPHYDATIRVELDKIFVNPDIIQVSENNVNKKINLYDFFKILHRSVLLGDPGAGKSTITQKILYELCKNYKKRIIGERILTPVLIVLREYSNYKKKNNSSFIHFLEEQATSKYQLPSIPPFKAFEYLLQNGHLLIIFDGLDELLEPSDRLSVVKQIELFCNLFPATSIVVTSRIVGYEKAPLDENKFDQYRLAPFNNSQITEYAERWFNQDINIGSNDANIRAKNYLKESTIISDLRTNPLLLALTCNLYKGIGYIPRNRPEIFKKCSEMLFDRWDPSRGINIKLPISNFKILLSHLAYWIFSNKSLRTGVIEDNLIKESCKFLLEHNIENHEKAEKASIEFFEFCRSRAWIFTVFGITQDGKRIYRFTHPTFLEYFTAIYLVRNNINYKNLWQVLSPKIEQRNWDMVSQLAFQIINEQVEGAGDGLFKIMVEEATAKNNAFWSFMSFGVRCLQFIYPSPIILKAMIEKILKAVIEIENFKEKNYLFNKEIITSFISTTSESRYYIGKVIQDLCIYYINNDNKRLALNSVDLCLSISNILFEEYKNYYIEEELFEYWNSINEKILSSATTGLVNLSAKYLLVFQYLFSNKKISLEKFFSFYKFNDLFKLIRSSLLNIRFKPFFYDLILIMSGYSPNFYYEYDHEECSFRWVRKQLEIIGDFFLTNIRTLNIRVVELPEIYDNNKKYYNLNYFENKYISGNTFLGLFFLVAIVFEVKSIMAIEKIRKNKNRTLKFIFDIIDVRNNLKKRHQKKYISKKALILNRLNKLNLPNKSISLIKSWMGGNFRITQLLVHLDYQTPPLK